MFKIPENMKNGDIINVNERVYEHRDGRLVAKTEVSIGGGITNEDMDGMVDFLSDTYEKLQGNLIDLTVNNFFLKEITSNIKFEVKTREAISNRLNKFYLQIRDGGSYIVEWFGDVRWPGDSAPELSRGSSDLLMFYSYNNGKTWFGTLMASGIDDNIPPEFTNIASAYTAVSVDTTDDVNGIVKDTSGKLFTYYKSLYCYSSNDGKVWKKNTMTKTGVSFTLYDVKFINGLYYGVGENGYVGTSPDMINWTEVTKLGGFRVNRIGIYNGTMIAIGNSTKLFTSTNGINWTDVTIPGMLNNVKAFVYKDGYYYILHDNKVRRSSDLVEWTQLDLGLITGSSLTDLYLLNNKLFVVGIENRVAKHLTSNDGVVWVDDEFTIPEHQAYLKITQIDNLFIMSHKSSGDYGIYLSTDMKTWKPIENSIVKIPTGTVMNMGAFNVVDNILAIAGERGYYGYATLEVA